MKIKKHPLKGIVCLTISFFLTACATYTRPPLAPKYQRNAVAGGAIAGGLIGAWAGGISSASIPATVGVGTLVGSAIAAYYSSEHHQLKTLQQMGVQVVQIGDGVRIIIPADKIFPINSATIIPASYPTLDFLISYIKRYGDVPITVMGYTDDIGSPLRNLNVSQRQAQSIKGYLWSHGIPFKSMRALGYGQIDPIANNISPVGQAYNRRIEIIFHINGHKLLAKSEDYKKYEAKKRARS